MSLRTTAYYELGTYEDVGQSKMMFATDFRNAVFTVINTGFTGTIKFYSSNSETRPDLGSAASSTNEYATTQVIDLEDGSSVDGDVGLSFTTDSAQNMYEMNINAAKWVGIKVTARSAGSTIIRLDLADNQ